MYIFNDTYDWHAGLAAGGTVAGVNEIQDAWADALVKAGKAAVFKIYGTWSQSPAAYIFSSSWLVPNTDPELIAVTPEP